MTAPKMAKSVMMSNGDFPVGTFRSRSVEAERERGQPVLHEHADAQHEQARPRGQDDGGEDRRLVPRVELG